MPAFTPTDLLKEHDRLRWRAIHSGGAPTDVQALRAFEAKFDLRRCTDCRGMIGTADPSAGCVCKSGE